MDKKINCAFWSKLISSSLLSILTGVSLTHSATKLDIGAEYRLRGIQLNNPTYASELPIDTGKTINYSYYSNRAKVYVKGKFDSGVEIGTVLQAIGVSGSTGPILNRYPDEKFVPFIENAYLKANDVMDWPINLTFGRQPYAWGNGMLLSDDDLGFNGIRADIGPYWGVRSYLFAAKAQDKLIGELNSDIYLGGLSYDFGIHKVLLGTILEKDQTGSNYTDISKIMDNPSSSTNSVTSDKISRQFIDLQISARLEKGAFYNLEYVMQRGSAEVPGRSIKLSGSALSFEGGFDFIHPRYKRMILAFVFMQGSGDKSSTSDENEKFNPSFGHKYDGLEYSGYGDFFAATPYSFFNQDKIILPVKIGDKIISQHNYTTMFSGLRMFGFRGSVNPWEPFTAGLEFYIFTALETPDIRNGAPTTIDDNEIGREMVISASYLYSNRLKFLLRWGKLFPSVNLNNIGSSRITFEVSGKF